MNPQGRQQLADDEGCETKAYPDPLTGGEPWTIGYGHTGPEVHPGLEWLPAHCEAVFDQDIAAVEHSLAGALSWWSNLDPVRQDVLTNMGFNMGVHGLLQFHDTLTAVQGAQYAQASEDMLRSRWAVQLPARSRRLAAVMASGAYPP